MKSLFLALGSMLFTTSVRAEYSQTIADCKTVANKFMNTCTGAPTTAVTDWDSFTGATVTCSQTSCPTGYGTAPNCSWTRKLCVTCSTVSSVVYMRIQTNTLPAHCYSTPSTTVDAEYDITVKWNPSITSYTEKSWTSQSTFDSSTCAVMKTSSVPSNSELTNNNSDASVTTIAGFSINGVIIFGTVSANKVDPYYPQSWSGAVSVVAENVDACIGHPDFDGIYHYHFLPPCVIGSSYISTTRSCAAVSACTSDLKTYALTGFASSKALTVVGMAKDGHVIYGPYDSSGDLFDCNDLDICGGYTFSDGDYGYIYHTTYPYIINCWGPGSDLTYYSSCSSNTCESDASLLLAKITVAFAGLMALIL